MSGLRTSDKGSVIMSIWGADEQIFVLTIPSHWGLFLTRYLYGVKDGAVTREAIM